MRSILYIALLRVKLPDVEYTVGQIWDKSIFSGVINSVAHARPTTKNRPGQLSGHRSDPQETPIRSSPPVQDRVAWLSQVSREGHIEGMATGQHVSNDLA